jgi:DMSO/TMAO reductase YedYZ molybdopterin-dependent catalytic subunit
MAHWSRPVYGGLQSFAVWFAIGIAARMLGLRAHGKEQPVVNQDMSRRTLLKGGGAAVAGLSALQVAGPAHAFPGGPNDEVIPWLDQPAPVPPELDLPQLVWEELDSFLTPVEDFFVVSHYGNQDVPEAGYRLRIGGLVARPQTWTLEQLKGRPRRDVTFTLECSGNTGLPFFIGGIGNARWAGTPLAPLLESTGIRDEGTEVVFYGADSGQVTIRDNGGVLSGGESGTVVNGALTITEQFARSMSLEEALNRDNLLCYEMNGVPLPKAHGFPLRLIAPGWYGVANVKWLTRIEVMDQRYASRFMARDYVTIREQMRGGQTVWTFNTVKHDRLKSAPAKVTRRRGRYTIMGAAWGAPIAEVEVQIDGGRWRTAELDDRRRGNDGSRDRSGFAWRFWTLDWGKPAAGEHTVRSRAFDVDGNVQPALDDPYLASKVTYWESNGQIARRVAIPRSS